MIEWISNHTPQILLALLVIILVILLAELIKKLIQYYQDNVCDWAAQRLAKCVPAGQCADAPVYVQAKRCPQAQLGTAASARPVVAYASAPSCAAAPLTSSPCAQAAVSQAAPAVIRQRAAQTPVTQELVESMKVYVTEQAPQAWYTQQ